MNLEDLEKRLVALEDKEAIKELHREYLFYISNLEFDKAVACFWDDIEVEVANYGVKKGKTEVVPFFMERIYRNVAESRDGHFTGQPVIELEGNKASGHWMFYRFLADESAGSWVQGRYDCRYEKRDGQWRFSVLKMVRPWPAFLGTSSPGGKGAGV
jgi:hypothetical protein